MIILNYFKCYILFKNRNITCLSKKFARTFILHLNPSSFNRECKDSIHNGSYAKMLLCNSLLTLINLENTSLIFGVLSIAVVDWSLSNCLPSLIIFIIGDCIITVL